MAMLLQSSSASITATMAALVSGAIDRRRYMVIGQNIGAVSITVISVIGASINAKRTVAVNVILIS